MRERGACNCASPYHDTTADDRIRACERDDGVGKLELGNTTGIGINVAEVAGMAAAVSR